MKTYKLIFVFASLLQTVVCFAQKQDIHGIQKKMYAYTAGKSSSLFVHFDKNVYTNNETVWFTAYVLGADTAELAMHNTLSVALVNEGNKAVVLNEKALIQGGIGSGSMLLPDTLSPGDYHLVACTNLLNKNGKPVLLFSQAIMVKTISVQSFNAGIKLTDSGKKAQPIRVQIDATVNDLPAGKRMPLFKIRYRLGQTVVNTVTDIAGLYTIAIDPNHVTATQNTLLVDVFLKKEVKHLMIKLPFNEKSIALKFFPEGGYLAAGQLNTIGWEAKTADSRAVSVEGILFKNKQAIDTLRTNAYGIGKFRLLPYAGDVYSIKITKSNIQSHDTTFLLPKQLKNIPAINIAKAVANDTLRATLRTGRAMKLHAIVHNYKDIYNVIDINTNANGSNLRIALSSVPKGIAALTIMDSLFHPLAERLFFAHYNQADNLAIITNKNVYGNRENVELKLKLSSANGKSQVNGIASVACVQDNRITLNNQQDIESFAYLTNELGNLTLNPLGRGYGDIEYMENVLLTKGWRKYNWVEMMTADTSAKENFFSADMTGTVTKGGHILKAPVIVSMICDSAFTMVPTDDKGKFIIPSTSIVTYRDKKVMLTLNRRDKSAFEIKVTDPFVALFNKAVFEDKNLFESNSQLLYAGDTQSRQLSGSEKIRVLKEVKIMATKNDILYRLGPKQGPNECGDYVCPSNIINCPNHPTMNRPAVKGEKYLRFDGGEMIYWGCEPPPINFYVIKGIKAAKTFYPTDYSLGLSQPDYQSTIYWNNFLTFKNGEASVKFPTSDITGTYRVVVQGLTDNDVVYNTYTFEVKKQTGL